MWKQRFLQSLFLNIARVSKCQSQLLDAFCTPRSNQYPALRDAPATSSNYPMPPICLYGHSVLKSHLKLPETTTLFSRIIFPLQGQKEKVRMFWNLKRPFPSLPQSSLTLSLFLSKRGDCLRRFAILGWANQPKKSPEIVGQSRLKSTKVGKTSHTLGLLGLVQFLQSHKAAPQASSVGSASCAFPCNGKNNTWI